MNNFSRLKTRKIFLFDFDGTLLNSEIYHKKAHSIVLSKILGKDIDLSDEDFQRYIGKTDDVIFDMYKKDFNVEFDKEKMINLKKEIAVELLNDKKVKIFDYFFDLTNQFDDKKFFIVSSQDETLLTKVIKNKGIYKYFQHIYCMPSLGISKKDFLLNLNKYGLQSSESVLFEDVDSYLLLGKTLGMISVAVENDLNRGKLKNFDILIKT